jgi:signal transduction histidine kinase
VKFPGGFDRARGSPAASVTARLAVSRDVSQALLGSLDPRDLSELALFHLQRLVSSDAASVLAIDEKGDSLETLGGKALDLPFGLSLERLVNPLAIYHGEGSGVLLIELSNAPPAPIVVALREEGAKHAIGVVLEAHNNAFGMVVLRRTEEKPFETEDLLAAQEVAGPLSLALESARLHRDLERSFASLRDAHEELVRRERLAAVGTMAAVMAHEVRTPLAVLFNAVASLRRMGIARGDAETLVQIIDEESKRLNRLVHDLLEFGRPDRRRFAEVDVLDLVSETMDLVRRDPRVPATVTVELETQEDAGVAVWDSVGVRHALMNLVLNAAQAIGESKGSGVVQVRVRTDRTGTMIRLLVEDDGPGIPREMRRRMFDPFVTTRPHGVGLGLAVVRRALDDHDGDLAIRGREGGGTQFELVLPRTPKTEVP